VLGGIGIWRGSNEETRAARQDGGENVSETRKSAGASMSDGAGYDRRRRDERDGQLSSIIALG